MRSRFRLWALALAVIWIGAGGCYWLRYDALARTHVELLLAMVTKLQDVTEDRGAPSRMAEYRYPLERAREFVRIVEGRFATRASLQELRELCDVYERALEAAALVGTTVPVGRGALRDVVEPVRARAQAVVEALDREAAG